MAEEDATYRLYADIFPRIADSFSEQARQGLTVAMGPVQQRMDEIARSMGDSAGREFGSTFRSRVDEAIRLASGTVRISLDLDTSSVYAKLEAIRADTADGVSQNLNVNVSGLSEVRAELDSLHAVADVTVHLDEASLAAAQARLDALGGGTGAGPDGASELASIQAKAEASLAQIQAKDEATRGQVQAKSEAALAQISAKDEATRGQIKAKNESALAIIAARDDAVAGQISAKDEATRGQIQARNEAALALIQARNDAVLEQIKARSDAATSSGGGLPTPSLIGSAIGLGVTAAAGPATALVLGSLPVLFAAVGAAAEKSDTQVGSAFSDMTTSAKKTLQQGFQPLVPVFVSILNSAKTTLNQLEPVFEQASKAAGPLITTMTQGFLQATVIGVGGFASAMKGLQPIADAVSQGLVNMARAASGFLQALNVTLAAQGVTLLFNAVDSLLPVLAQLVNALAPLGNALLRLVPTIADLIHGALDVIAPVAQFAAQGITVLSETLDHLATPLGALVAIAAGVWAAFKVGQGVMAAYNFITGAAEVLTSALSPAMEAAAASSGVEAVGMTGLAAAEGEAAAAATALDVAMSPLIIGLGVIAAAAGAVVVGVLAMKQQFTDFFNDPSVQGTLNKIINPNGASSGGGAGFLGPITGFLNSKTVANAVSVAPTAGQANIDTANLLQTDLTNRITLATAATSATQAYSDANYQLGASARAVESSSRAEQAAVRGVADAQSNLADAITAVSNAQQKLSDDENIAREDTLALTEARKQAAQTIIDLRLQLTDQAASQESARIALFDAQKAAQAAGIDTTHGPVGLPTGPVTAANEARQKLQLALVQAQNSYNDSVNAGNKLQDTANDAFAKGINQSAAVVAAQKALSGANRTVAADLIAVGRAQDGVKKAQQGVIDAKQAVVDATQAHTDALRSEAAQARAVTQAYTDMIKAQGAATISTDLATQAGRDNYKQAQDLITADVKLGLSSRDLTARFADQESQLGLTSTQIFDTAQQTGQFTDNQLAQLAEKLSLTNAKTQDLQINLDGTKVRLGDLNGIKVNFDVNGVGTIDLNQLYASLGYNAGQIQQINQQASQPGGPPQGSANALLHADGGPIHGPGGPRDDLVFARLSNGEHVWTADEVAKAGGHGAMERMRQAIRGYAAGGAVTPGDALAAARIIALGMGKGTAADTAVAAKSAVFGSGQVFFPDHHLTSLNVRPPTISGATLVGVIPQGQHRSIIDAALAADAIPVGQWPQWEIGLNTLVQRESGWNPNAINLWDSNAKAGHPSQGLGQTIPGTFQAYRNKSLANSITDPVANLAAVINYINADYHGIGNVQQANPALPPRGYDNGGWLTGLGINTTGKPEAVLDPEESRGLKAAVKNKPIRLDTYSIAQLAQAIVMANQERPINVSVRSGSGLGVFV